MQKRLLTAQELYTQTEFQRYKLAALMKRATRRRIQQEQARASLALSGPTDFGDMQDSAPASVATDAASRDSKLPAVYRGGPVPAVSPQAHVQTQMQVQAQAVTLPSLFSQANRSGLVAPPPTPAASPHNTHSAANNNINTGAPISGLRVETTGYGAARNTSAGLGGGPGSTHSNSVAQTPPVWTTSVSSLPSVTSEDGAARAEHIVADLVGVGVGVGADATSLVGGGTGAAGPSSAFDAAARDTSALISRAIERLQTVAENQAAGGHGASTGIDEGGPSSTDMEVDIDADISMMRLPPSGRNNPQDASIISTPGEDAAPGEVGGHVQNQQVSQSLTVTTTLPELAGHPQRRSQLSITNASRKRTEAGTVISASVPPADHATAPAAPASALQSGNDIDASADHPDPSLVKVRMGDTH